MSRILRIAAAVALVAAGVPAAAFVRETTTTLDPFDPTCLWRRSHQVTFHVNATKASPAPCGDAAAAEAAAAAGYQTWATAACTDLSFVNGGPTTKTAVGRDNVNLVVFRSNQCEDVVPPGDSCQSRAGACAAKYNCWDHGPGVIALTTHSFDDATGEIWDSDIELNGWDGASPPTGSYFTCGTAQLPDCTAPVYGKTGCNAVDVQAVVTHEAGHVLGLDHVCQFAAPYDPPGSCATDAVMVQQVGKVAQRTLAADDIAGICKIYPAGESTLTCVNGGAVPPAKSSGGGGCSSAGDAGIFALLALALLAPAARRRGRA